MRNTFLAAAIVCLMALINSAYSANGAEDAQETKQVTAAAKKVAQPSEADGKAASENGEKSGEKTEEAEEESRVVTVAEISLSGSLPESAPEPGLFGELSRSLSQTLRRLRRAADDDEVAAVILKLRNPSIGRGRLAELRAAIDRVQATGKKVYAQIQSATPTDYLVACTCDEIVMPESGVFLLPGVRAEVTYYKGLLEKLGIQADMMQVGDFKGAAEPFTREGMSPAFRKQYESVIDDFYQQLVSTVATDRKLPVDRVKQLVDRGLFSPQRALKAGLIDTVAYQEDFYVRLKEDHKADELVVERNYGRKTVDTDFSGMMGFIKLFELMTGASSTERANQNKKIAIIYGSGAIMTGEGGMSLFGGEVMGSTTIVKALKKAGDDDTVAAIVFRVNSPGGSALASDLIWRQIQQVREQKPVIASMGDVAASGGYYVSVGCDKIFANEGTLTGSIGVVGGKMALAGLYDKVGITTEVISRGRHSGMMSSDQPFSETERQVWQEYMEDVYEDFTSKVSAGRKIDRKRLDDLAGGRIWTGRQAQQNGLVDEIGTFYDAIEAAKQMAGVQSDERIELLELPEPRNFLDQLFDVPVDGSRSQLRNAVNQAVPGAANRMAELETLKRLFSEPALMVMPYRVEIR